MSKQHNEQNEQKMPYLSEGKDPVYANEYAAGLDLPLYSKEALTVRPGDHLTAHTGISVALPPMTFGLVAIRSGLGSKGLVLSNGVGIIDADYRGEIRMPLFHHGTEEITLEPGERIAQMIVLPMIRPDLVKVEHLDETERGTDGFGSSGRF